jgi:hypothetical protein
VLNALATFAVAGFIVMTAWGWFSGADQTLLRTILGTLLVVIVLPLLIPFTEPKTGIRQALYGSLAIAMLVLLFATCWEVMG